MSLEGDDDAAWDVLRSGVKRGYWCSADDMGDAGEPGVDWERLEEMEELEGPVEREGEASEETDPPWP